MGSIAFSNTHQVLGYSKHETFLFLRQAIVACLLIRRKSL